MRHPPYLDPASVLQGLRHVVGCLHAVPRLGPTAEGFVQPDRHFGGNPSMAVHKVGKLFAADVQNLRCFRHGQAQGLKAIMLDG
jgi:hypothetical protein